MNAQYYPDLIQNISERPEAVVNTFRDGKHFWKINQDTNMKLDAIVGNPPYQVMDGGTDRGAIPVYQHFVEIAKKCKPYYVSMIMPSRWFAGGRGLDDFRIAMLNDKCIQYLYDYPKSRDCFPTVDIAGGICYFLWNSRFTGLTQITNRIGLAQITKERRLNEFDIFVRDNIGIEIVHKIMNTKPSVCSDLVLKVSPFGLRSYVRGEKKDSDNSVIVVSSGGIGYLPREAVTKNIDVIDKYKVVIGYLNPDRAGVNNSSQGNNVTTKVFVYEPRVVITESYIVIGVFNSKSEANNYASYIKCKLTRMLIYLTLSSIHITQGNFRFVPLQDFTRPWTDADLYAKYNLTDEEIQFIESMIKPME